MYAGERAESLKHFQDACRGRINSSGSLQNFDKIKLDKRAYIKN